MYKNILLPASILAGVIIGAGMFSLPFVFSQAGFWTSVVYLAVFSLIYIGIYFTYADLILETPGEHRLVGYAEIYFGRAGFWFSILISLIQLLLVLTIYLILAPSFTQFFISGAHLYHLLVFWAAGSAVILFNTRRIAVLEFLIVAGMIGIILLIGMLGFKEFSLPAAEIDFSKILAVGPILFALSGSLAVPEAVSYFRETKTPILFLKPAIILGSILPAAAYLVFTIGILGLSPAVSEDAVSGLIGRVPPVILILLGILGVLSLISSYIVVGLNARRILEYDLIFPAWLSRFLIAAVPLVLYFAGLQNFIKAVSLVGASFLPLESLLIILIWFRIRGKI